MRHLDAALTPPASSGREEGVALPARRWASWLSHPPLADSRTPVHLEHVLAIGRAFLTIVALVAIFLDPQHPSQRVELTYLVLGAYVLYSLAVLWLVYLAPHITPAQGRVLHSLDILWTIAVTFVGDGPVTPFFLFFVYVVVAAAYRWGLVGTVATAVVTVTVYLTDVAIFLAGTVPLQAPAPETLLLLDGFELHRVILQVAYLLLTGFLLGYLAEQDKRSRAELAAIASLTREPQVHRGVGGSVAAVSRSLLRMFDAESVCFVLQDFEAREASLWRLDRGAAEATRNPPRTALDADQQAVWLFPDAGRVWCSTRDGQRPPLLVHVLRPDSAHLARTEAMIPDLAGAAPFTQLVVANFGLPDEWAGRVYLFNPRLRGGRQPVLRFVNALMEHVTPALTNVFLVARLRARVTAAERARVARELHDGAIQALLGIELKVEALRRKGDHLPAAVAGELDEVQQLVRQQVLELRELMQALKPLALDASEQLPDVLASIVERFRRDTGVPARFMFTGGATHLPPTTALEVVRIAQEALVNVRKHSRAQNVLVRLTGAEHGCILTIEDDGIGFGFEGHLSGEELDRRRLGPAIIRERARAARAHLSIDSTPGAGARIELIVNTAHV